MKVFVILSCIFVMAIAGDIPMDKPIQVCGQNLANLRVTICYGRMYYHKKRVPSVLERSIEQWEEDWPWRGRRGALSWARYKRGEGLADLCCLKACTAEVISEFC